MLHLTSVGTTIPDIDKWALWETDIRDIVRDVDYALVDATFFKDGELGGRDMSKIRHPFATESMDLFDSLTDDEKARERIAGRCVTAVADVHGAGWIGRDVLDQPGHLDVHRTHRAERGAPRGTRLGCALLDSDAIVFDDDRHDPATAGDGQCQGGACGLAAGAFTDNANEHVGHDLEGAADA